VRILIPVRYPKQAAQEAALPAAAATDKEMNENNNKLLEKISSVNEIINSFDAGEPPYSFRIKCCAESVKQARQLGYATIACAAVMLARSMRPSASLQTAGLVIAFLAIIYAVYCIVYASRIEKNDIAEISGDSITVKGRTYSCSEISEIKGAAINNLKIMSNGNKIVTLNKSCDGCGDLVRWAKQHNIPINDNNTGNMESFKQKNAVLVAIITVLCIAIAFLIVFLKRM
jgi:hypothetical protein